MPPKKKIKLIEAPAAADEEARADRLSDDTMAMVFEYFGPLEIMRMRCVCKKWRGAAKKTIPAPVDFNVRGVNKYRALVAMTFALPNLQQIALKSLNPMQRSALRGSYRRVGPNRYSSGEDPFDDPNAEVMYDINLISNFSKLRSLSVMSSFDLNGRYPVLFNFPLLQKLHISGCKHLKWDLEVLRGLPLLKELYCHNVPNTAGDIKSLRVLKDSIEKITIVGSRNVRGNFMDLADFPNLKMLILQGRSFFAEPTAVITGDIRTIGENDFPKLKYLRLPKTVIGGDGYQFQHIADVPDMMNAIYSCMKRFDIGEWSGYLSSNSPDWYNSYPDYEVPQPPFNINVVKVGSRLGWLWGNEGENCEVNWLDPEPERHSYVGSREGQLQLSEEYERYTDELQLIEKYIDVFKGYHQPPAEDEYRRIAQPFIERVTREIEAGFSDND